MALHPDLQAFLELANAQASSRPRMSQMTAAQARAAYDKANRDLIELRVMAKVTSVSKHDHGSGPRCRIELSITHIECEDEEEEEEEHE